MTNPTLIATPFAENGDKNVIPESVGAEPQNATMQAGFPPITQQKISEGGIPPERNDFNGILNLYGQHIVHLNKGLPYEFDQTFANKIGGYPIGAELVLSDGLTKVVNTVANNTNDPNVDMTGWLNPSTYPDVITARNAGFKCDGSDETALALQCIENGLRILIPIGSTIGIDVSSGIGTQWAYGLGEIKWLNYVASENMERVVNSNVPVHAVNQDTYQQQQNANVRGALGGRNVGKRFECNPTKTDNYTFNNMQTLIDYGGADIIADMVAITDREVKQYTGVTYTASTAQHESFKTDDIQAGDYIRAGSNILGVVLSVDKSSGLITLIDGWGNTDSKELNVTPLSGSVCYTPIAYRMWGRNDYVTARANNSEIYNIIGYELDVVAGHDLQDACGFFPVAFGTDTCVAAFRTGRGTRNWWYGLQILDDSANAGVHVGKGVTYGIQHGAQNTANSITVYSSQALYGMKVDSANGAALRSDNTGVAVDINNADTGVKFNSGGASSSVIRNYVDNFLIKSDVLGKGSFSMTALGETNRNIKTYTNISENITLTRDNTTSIAIISSSAVTSVQLSASFEDGEILEFYSNQSQNVDVGGLVTLSPSKKYTKLLYAGSAWIVLI